jgi:hypothetical protein
MCEIKKSYIYKQYPHVTNICTITAHRKVQTMRHISYALQPNNPVLKVQLFNIGYYCHIRSMKLSVCVVKNKTILMSLSVSELSKSLIN